MIIDNSIHPSELLTKVQAGAKNVRKSISDTSKEALNVLAKHPFRSLLISLGIVGLTACAPPQTKRTAPSITTNPPHNASMPQLKNISSGPFKIDSEWQSEVTEIKEKLVQHPPSELWGKLANVWARIDSEISTDEERSEFVAILQILASDYNDKYSKGIRLDNITIRSRGDKGGDPSVLLLNAQSVVSQVAEAELNDLGLQNNTLILIIDGDSYDINQNNEECINFTNGINFAFAGVNIILIFTNPYFNQYTSGKPLMYEYLKTALNELWDIRGRENIGKTATGTREYQTFTWIIQDFMAYYLEGEENNLSSFIKNHVDKHIMSLYDDKPSVPLEYLETVARALNQVMRAMLEKMDYDYRLNPHFTVIGDKIAFVEGNPTGDTIIFFLSGKENINNQEESGQKETCISPTQ